MHNINMPCCLQLCRGTLQTACRTVFTPCRDTKRERVKGKRVTPQALRARLCPSLSAGPNNGNMLGDMSRFIWHRGPGLCSSDASLACAITAHLQRWWVHEERSQVGLLKRRGRWIGPWCLTHTGLTAHRKQGWEDEFGRKDAQRRGGGGNRRWIAWNWHTVFFIEEGQCFTTIAVAGKQGAHSSGRESVKLTAHCCYCWIAT